MSNQIQLAWSVSIAGTTFTAAQAAAALAAVVLYSNTRTDPVLGQALGLTVASDVTVPTSTGATRTLTLNMGAATAPPPFLCRPASPTPPVLPYRLERIVPLAGQFAVQKGSAVVTTTANQKPSLNNGDIVQFASQLGVDYTVLSFTPTTVTLTAPFTGPTSVAKIEGFKVLPAGATLTALYSTSTLDSASGSGARTISLSYLDSLGAAGTVVVALAGKRPVQITLAGGTIDISVIVDMSVASTGGFQNSVGEITLSELSAPIVFDDTDDQAQMKLARPFAYLPPSYYALAQQGAALVPETPTGDQLKIPLTSLFAQTLTLALIVPVISAPISFLVSLVDSNATETDTLVVT